MFNLNTFLKEFILCQLLLLQLLGGAWARDIARIYGGEDEDIANVPFLVQIYFDGSFACAGTLISNNSVVTAASCLKDKDPAMLTVKGGASTQFDSVILSLVSRYMLPKSFNAKTRNMDVAVLKLQKEVDNPLVKPIGLSKKLSIDEGELAKINGWGATHLGALSYNDLQTTELTVIGNGICEDKFAFTYKITDSMFCAEATAKGSCYRDMGGPVLIDEQFCGIITSLEGCYNKNVPGVFTNILQARVRNFIEKAMLK